MALNYSNIYRAESFSTSMYVYSAMYVVMSIVTHELGHAMTMKIYKRKYGKIRLKIYYYLFPAIVTDTTDSYILPRYRRAFVYYAGVMVNLITFGLTLLLVPSAYSYMGPGIQSNTIWRNEDGWIPYLYKYFNECERL